jgi:excisionase family DNA binding protein
MVRVITTMSTEPATVATTFPRGPDDTTRLLTAEEVASRLGVQTSWVSKAARANRIPHICVGRYRRFRWPDIEAWLEGQRRGS